MVAHDDNAVRAALRRVWPDPGTVETVRLRVLAGGVNPRTFLAAAAGRRCVLRLAVPGAPALLDFATEVRAMRAAAAAGVAPAVVGADIAAGVLLTEYCERPWPAALACEPASIARLAAVLRVLHAVPLDLPVFAAAPIARGYLDALGGSGALAGQERAWCDELLGLAARYDARYEPTAFCHNDLVAANVLDDGAKLLLVDFEYAVRSAPLLDLANAAGMNDYTAVQRDMLLAAYYGDAAGAVTTAELDAAVRMVRLLAFFWARVGERRAVGTQVYSELAARFGATLQ